MVAGVRRVLISLALVVVAVGAAFVVAWGTEPSLALKPRGLEIIMLVRRLQWPLVGACVLACLITIGMVVAGARRAWWLLALAPVMFMFYQRFAGASFRGMMVIESPPFVAANAADFLKPESPVIGVMVEDAAYAYPCGCLFGSPVVLHSESDKRVLVMYSPYAGRARAFVVDHSIKAREIDIVSMPANAMLLYNSRIGQFINAFTGATPAGEKPTGIVSTLEAGRYSWQQWRTAHPETRVLAISYRVAGEKVVPVFTCPPPSGGLAADAKVALLSTAKPVALRADRVLAGRDLLNLSAHSANLLILRDKPSGRLRVYDRTVKGDLFPRFQRKSVVRKPDICYVDLDTNSLWTADLRCVDGYAKGERLRPIRLEEDLPWGTLCASYPGIELLSGQAP